MKVATIAILLVAGLVCGFLAIAGLLTGNTANQFFAIPAFLIGGLLMRLAGSGGLPPETPPSGSKDSPE